MSNPIRALLAAVLVAGACTPVYAQLAEAAASATHHDRPLPDPAKVYTNNDLSKAVDPPEGVRAVLPPEIEQAAGEGDAHAAAVCEKFVAKRLKAPGSARYPSRAGSVVAGGGASSTVTSHVDSQNGFGALLRLNYTCKVAWQGGDKWRLQSLNIAPN
jgi:hypothetical protein